jgi:hypothetical protein
VEAEPAEIDLAIRFGGLNESRLSDRRAVNAALGRLLRRALGALLREDDHQKM